MKYKEFIKRVKDLGFACEKAKEVYIIYDYDGHEYASVCHTIPNRISNMEIAWDLLDKDTQNELFDIIVEYAKTPIAERKEEKKYYLRHRFLGSGDGNQFLNQELEGNTWFLSEEDSFDNYQTQFTQKEIDEIKENYNTDLKDFEIIEVESWNQ